MENEIIKTDVRANGNRKINKNKNLLIIIVVLLAAATLAVRFFSPYPKVVDMVVGCERGDKFSKTTGKPCKPVAVDTSCQDGDVYNTITGELCGRQ